jgi:integrase
VLYLQVDANGSRRWIFRFTSPVTKRVNETSLGSAKDIELAEAKKRASKLRVMVGDGVDPVLAARAKDQRRDRESVTFKKALDQYASDFAGKAATRDKVALLHRHAAGLMGLSMASITTPTIARALGPVKARFPLQARRTLGLVESVLNYARVKGWRDGDNPAAWRGTFAFLWDAPKAGPGHRALPYPEIPAIFRLLNQRLPSATSLALQYLVLCAGRTSEILGAQWDEIDMSARTWTVPAARMKVRKPHSVPLSDGALEVLGKAQAEFGDWGYIFKGQSKSRLSSRALEVFLHQTLQIKHVSVHGMRSAFRDWAGDMTDTPREVCEAALAHTVPGVEGAYRRGTALEKRRVLMAAWGSYCTSEVGHVIPFVARLPAPLHDVEV